jgi:surfeit locus 1 family protein
MMSTHPSGTPTARTRPAGARIGVVLAALVGFALFVALGTWQLERRAWKLDLLARIETRVHAAPVPAPGPGQWAQVSAARDEYRTVLATGVFQHDLETLVQAVTVLGPGYWVVTPLRSADGTVVLVNRGFVTAERRNTASRSSTNPPGEVTVTGLLRVSEPRGTLLRHNDPAMDLWYSRDVAAIAAARKLGTVAPYFIDAAAAPPVPLAASPDAPVGGLTVLAFNNNHLAYALTWFALALMSAGAAVVVLRSGQQPAALESRVWR